MPRTPRLRTVLPFLAVTLFFTLQAFAAEQFVPTDNLSQVRQSASSVKLKDGRVLVLGGGDTGGNCTASAEVYDPVTDTFLPVGNMREPRKLHASVLLNDGRVLIMGGYCGFLSYTQSAEIFNPADNTFAWTGSMGRGRARFTATTLQDGRVLVIGGAGMNGSNDAELYYPEGGHFTTATGWLPVSVKDHTATLLPWGQVLIAGGWNNGNSTAYNLLMTFDPLTEAFSMTDMQLAEERAGHTATVLADGKYVLIAGGFNFRTGSNYPTRSAELIQIFPFARTVVGQTNLPRQYHSASLLADGRVLLTGGGTFNSDTRTAETYDPLLKRFTTSAVQLVDRRYEHVSVPLNDGRVLIAGDTSARGELFIPDLAPPVTTVSLDGVRHASGWFTTPVTATLAATDENSGIARTEYRFGVNASWGLYTAPIFISVDGSSVLRYRSSDRVGHTEAEKTESIRIDKTSPSTVAGLTGTTGNDGWYRSPVTVFLQANDGIGSGVARILYSLDNGSAWATYAGSFPIAAEGTTSLSYYSEDLVEHAESPKSAVVKIDTLAPTTSFRLSGTVGENGWYLSPVTVTLAGNDGAGSGVARTEYGFDNVSWLPHDAPVAVTAEGTTTVFGRSTDAAGNVGAGDAAIIRIDTKAPAISSSVPAPGATGVPVAQTIKVLFDGPVLGGGALANIEVTTVNRKGVATKIATVNQVVGSELTIDPVLALSGSTTYTVSIPAGAVKDEAGNPLPAPQPFAFTTASSKPGRK